jgi:hypothetical protein
LANYPPIAEFVLLQKQLAWALDAEASELAARPPVFADDEHQFATA